MPAYRNVEARRKYCECLKLWIKSSVGEGVRRIEFEGAEKVGDGFVPNQNLAISMFTLVIGYSNEADGLT
jgi:hypothetical protein